MTKDRTPADKCQKTALEALNEAHQLSLAPFAFQTAVCLDAFGLAAQLNQATQGLTAQQLADAAGVSFYTAETLLIAGAQFGLLEKTDKAYRLSKTGQFFFNDPLVKVDFAFTRDVCYEGLAKLKESFENERPEGLKVFGDWPTIYPALQSLPEKAKKSWFEFDHYYSDVAYAAALPLVFTEGVTHICDIGGNTGKWAKQCCAFSPKARVTVMDLPEQCETVNANMRAAGLDGRVQTCPVDMLLDQPLPPVKADVYWMSQFLDCFSASQIVGILKRVAALMDDKARVYVLEPLVGSQPFEAGNTCLAALSLYFTAMANGTSRFYSAEDFELFFDAAGLTVEKRVDGLGVGHSLYICRKKDA